MIPFFYWLTSPKTMSRSSGQGCPKQSLIARKPAIEFADGERRSMNGRRSAYDCDSGAIRQAWIEYGILADKVLA
jgi:hypothetical protein